MADAFKQRAREFLAYLRVECGLSANTIRAYADDLRQLAEFLAARGVHDPDAVDLDALIAHLRALQADGMAARSITRHLASLRMFFRYCHANHHCSRDPAELLESPRNWRRVPKVLHVQHVEALLNAIDPASPLAARDRALIELMYAAGTRASEVGAIAIDDVHFDLGIVKLTGKGRRQRLVPIGRPAVEAIRIYLEQLRPNLAREDQPTEALMLTRRGRPAVRPAAGDVRRENPQRQILHAPPLDPRAPAGGRAAAAGKLLAQRPVLGRLATAEQLPPSPMGVLEDAHALVRWHTRHILIGPVRQSR